MLKIALIVWIILGGTLAGIGVMVVLINPELNAGAMRFIPVAAGIGFAAALPLAFLAARRILMITSGR